MKETKYSLLDELSDLTKELEFDDVDIELTFYRLSIDGEIKEFLTELWSDKEFNL